MKKSLLSLGAFGLLTLGFTAGEAFRAPALQADTRSAGAYPRELTSYRDIVKRALPAVVSIRPIKTVQSVRGPENQILGVGSGVIVDPKGVILTNFHVVDGAEQLEVFLEDGRRFTTKNVKGDRKTDLAIVRVQTDKPLPALSFANSTETEVGDRVLAIGAPYGMAGTVTHGIISAKARDIGVNRYEDFLQTDAAVNPGNSGGPLIDMEGKVVGINSVIKSKSGGFQGISLAISSNLAKKVMGDLVDGGVVRRGYLGISILDIGTEVAKQLGVPENSGVVVRKIFENTPAAKSGLKVGDIIVKIDDKPISTGESFTKTIAGLVSGKGCELAIIRDGKPMGVRATVEQQPESFGVKD